mmetsp:Transcript_4295/g.12963  ORF Transcript_4295/g.12963 Transcript_4295/m.12963 type:complete len:790 (-) Transcript_4295:86-2455(-)
MKAHDDGEHAAEERDMWKSDEAADATNADVARLEGKVRSAMLAGAPTVRQSEVERATHCDPANDIYPALKIQDRRASVAKDLDQPKPKLPDPDFVRTQTAEPLEKTLDEQLVRDASDEEDWDAAAGHVQEAEVAEGWTLEDIGQQINDSHDDVELPWEQLWQDLERSCWVQEKRNLLSQNIVNYTRRRLVAPRSKDTICNGDKPKCRARSDSSYSMEALLERYGYETDLKHRLSLVTTQEISTVLDDMMVRMKTLDPGLLIQDDILYNFASTSLSVLFVVLIEGVEKKDAKLAEAAQKWLIEFIRSRQVDVNSFLDTFLEILEKRDVEQTVLMLGETVSEIFSELVENTPSEALKDTLIKLRKFIRRHIVAPMDDPTMISVRPFILGCSEFCRRCIPMTIRGTFESEIIYTVTLDVLYRIFQQFPMEALLDRAGPAARLCLALVHAGFTSAMNLLHMCQRQMKWHSLVSGDKWHIAQLAGVSFQAPNSDRKLPRWSLSNVGCYMFVAFCVLRVELVPDFRLMNALFLARILLPFIYQLLSEAQVKLRTLGTHLLRLVVERMEEENIFFSEDDAVIDNFHEFVVNGQTCSYARVGSRLVILIADLSEESAHTGVSRLLNRLLDRFHAERHRVVLLVRISDLLLNDVNASSWFASYLSCHISSLSSTNRAFVVEHLKASSLDRWLRPRKHAMAELSALIAHAHLASAIVKSDSNTDARLHHMLQRTRDMLARFAVVAESDAQNAPEETRIDPSLKAERLQLFRAASRTLEQSVAAIQIIDRTLHAAKSGTT